MNGGYKLNEKDIDSVLEYLKREDPENATPEMAIELLEHYKAKFHELAHDDPEKLKEIYEDLKKSKEKSN